MSEEEIALLRKKLDDAHHCLFVQGERIKQLNSQIHGEKFAYDHVFGYREPIKQLFNTKVSDLELTTRAVNCLNGTNIETVGDILGIGEERLLRLPNFGVSTGLRVSKAINRRRRELLI